MLEGVVGSAGGAAGGDALEAVPEGLRAEALGGEAPRSGQGAVAVPVGDFRFGAGGADAVEGGQQQVVGGGGAAARGGPGGEQGVEGAAAAGGLPEGGGQAELAGGGLDRDGGGALADECGDALGAAEVGLLHDAGLAVDALGDGDVVVGFLALPLGDDAGHG